MSAGVEEWPVRTSAAERASTSLQPIASSTWLGWETPGRTSAPVEQSIPAESNSIKVASAEQPGKPMLAIPGRRSRSAVGPYGVAHGTASSTEVIRSLRRSRKRCSSPDPFSCRNPRGPPRARYGGDIQRAERTSRS